MVSESFKMSGGTKMVDNRSIRPTELPAQPGLVRLMCDGIPGGIFRCLPDPVWTILEVSRGFLNLFGYTAEEMREKFHNHYLDMIHPHDRRAVTRAFQKHMETGTDHCLEYRVKHRDGHTLWILEQSHLMQRDGEPDTLCCTLTDITESKKLQEQLRLSLERHQILMDQTDDIIIEWNMETDSFLCSPKWETKFGYMPQKEHITRHILHGDSHIHPEDRQRVAEALRSIRRGALHSDLEFRICTADGRYLWCRARMTVQTSQANHPVHAIGLLVDIDSEKRQAEKLLEIAQRDPLTNLLNKVASQKRIEEYLNTAADGDCSALLIVDLDNFKQINDSMGHLVGDAILVDAAQRLKTHFRSTDTVGRLGGDEFIIHIQNIQDVSIVQKKAEQLILELGDIETVNNGMENSPSIALSCSIGAAIYPKHGKSFKELYRHADLALYQSKKNGKNQYNVYDGSYQQERILRPYTQPASIPEEKVDADGTGNLLDHLSEHCFHILYHSRDVETAVQSILEMVGKKFNVSRSYIFEDSEDGSYCRNTFEWCNEGISPQIDNLRCISYEKDLNNRYRDNFNEEGIFYCRDIRLLEEEPYAILAPQGIKALLQSAIYDNGVFRGFVGFDDCSINRFWTQDQVDALALISEILSVFLLKHRAQQRTVQAEESIRSILENQSTWIYLIDPKSYELLYVNRCLGQIFPSAQIGMHCYEAFFRRDHPCTECLFRKLTEKNQSLLQEVYHPSLDLWLMTDTSMVTWHNRPAVLMCCFDITPYKKAGTNDLLDKNLRP